MCSKSYKYILFFVLIGIMLFFPFNKVDAKIIDINELYNHMDNGFINVLNESGSSITSSIDTDNKKINFLKENEIFLSLDYGEDYVEFNDDTVLSAENANDIFGQEFTVMTFMTGVFNSILELSGYENKTVSEEFDINDQYDKYGVLINFEDYSFSGGNDEEGTWTSSGSYIRKVKYSLDTDKIDALMSEYGVTAKSYNERILESVTPNLNYDEISYDYVKLLPSVGLFTSDKNLEAYCDIYRSYSRDGDYVKINGESFNCLDDSGYVDGGLESDTTYYYKLKLVKGTKFSNVLEVTTTNEGNAIVNDKITNNPRTGNFIPTLIVVSIMIVSFIAVLFNIRTYKFN